MILVFVKKLVWPPVREVQRFWPFSVFSSIRCHWEKMLGATLIRSVFNSNTDILPKCTKVNKIFQITATKAAPRWVVVDRRLIWGHLELDIVTFTTRYWVNRWVYDIDIYRALPHILSLNSRGTCLGTLGNKEIPTSFFYFFINVHALHICFSIFGEVTTM